MGRLKVARRDPRLLLGTIVLTPQNDEDAGEKRDDSWNDAKIESENSDEAYKNQIDRE